jgi:asparagine N-glycosylation enzyme membrane subunit Stt3
LRSLSAGRRDPPPRPAQGNPVILVRLMFFLAIGAIAVSGLLYLYSKDRKYLRFIGKIIKFTIILLVVVLLFYFFERIVGPML